MSGQKMNDGMNNSAGAGILGRDHEEHGSGAKAPVFAAGLLSGLKPGPTAPTGRSGPTFPDYQSEIATQAAPMTLVEVREQLKGVKGKRYWRSVDELADTEEFQKAVEREFPSSAQEWVDPVSRRGFMKLMGASLALAGLAGGPNRRVSPIIPMFKRRKI